MKLENIYGYDIETFVEIFLFTGKKVNEDKWVEFAISPYENQLKELIKWLKNEPIDFLYGFNNNSFDYQVVQYILDNYKKWKTFSNQEIVDIIYAFSQKLILNQDNERPPYKEWLFDIPQIDLMSIHGYTNTHKRVSLKWLEFMMDMEVDEMPIDHHKRGLTEEECQMVKNYCRNDILATETLWQYTRGNCENILYKGKDKIQERIDTIEEFKLKSICFNYSDVKIGETINLKGYMEEAGIDKLATLYDRKKEKGFTPTFTFGDCIPSYVQFQSQELINFCEKMKTTRVNLTTKEEFPITIDTLKYVVGKGGIHSVNTPCILESTDDYDLIEFDVSSQYPASLIKRKLYPSHLGISWLINYKKLVEMRLDAKNKGKKDPKYKGIAESLKLSINGGAFGKMNDTYSVQYDPYPHFQCTIGNQFEILMLVEWFLIAGVEILSANTDGALCKVPNGLKEEFYRLCHQWEEVIGNTVTGQLEFTTYNKYVMTSVNDYIAIKDDGTLKQKGDFLTNYELNKNKSKKIVPIALEKYFIEGIPVEDTIRNHKNIFDFCIAKKGTKDYYYQGNDRKTGKINIYNKLIRYYCSKKIGERLYKVKHDHSTRPGVKQSVCESTSELQVLFNKPYEVQNFEEYSIDYEFYENECKKLIYQIEPEVKRKETILKKRQIEMF